MSSCRPETKLSVQYTGCSLGINTRGREEESRVEEKEITGCDPDLETWRAQPTPQGIPELVRLIPLRAKMERPLRSSLHQSLLGHLREGWPPKMLRGRGHLLNIPQLETHPPRKEMWAHISMSTTAYPLCHLDPLLHIHSRSSPTVPPSTFSWGKPGRGDSLG